MLLVPRGLLVRLVLVDSKVQQVLKDRLVQLVLRSLVPRVQLDRLVPRVVPRERPARQDQLVRRVLKASLVFVEQLALPVRRVPLQRLLDLQVRQVHLLLDPRDPRVPLESPVLQDLR